MQKDKEKLSCSVMPTSRIVHFSVSFSTKEVLPLSPKGAFQCAVLFHVTNTSYPWQALPALGGKTRWRTSSLQNTKAESAGLGQHPFTGPAV